MVTFSPIGRRHSSDDRSCNASYSTGGLTDAAAFDCSIDDCEQRHADWSIAQGVQACTGPYGHYKGLDGPCFDVYIETTFHCSRRLYFEYREASVSFVLGPFVDPFVIRQHAFIGCFSTDVRFG